MNYTKRHQAAAEELARLRETMNSLAATVLAQDALMTALSVIVARELDFRGVLNELEAHATDLVAEVPLAGDEAQTDAIRDAAHCLLEDRLAGLRRNFIGSACNPWQGTA